MTFCRAKNRARAFTLVELIIVVAVLAIAAGLAVPMFSQTSAEKLRAAANVLAADLAFTKVESIAHGDDLRVIVFNSTDDQYHIAAASDDATPITNPITRQPYLVSYGSGSVSSLTDVTIDSYSLDGDDRLGFNIYGGTDQATDATITLECDGKTITVTVNPGTGETTISPIS